MATPHLGEAPMTGAPARPITADQDRPEAGTDTVRRCSAAMMGLTDRVPGYRGFVASSDGLGPAANPMDAARWHGAGRGETVTTDAPLEQVFDGRSLFLLRSAVAAHALRLGLSERRVADLILIANELATNAVRHGGRHGRLRLWRDHHAVHCQVADTGPGLADPVTVGTVPAPIGAVGGRGLWIVRQLCDRLHISSGPAGATLTAILDATGPAR